jgi:uncharacterized membrane protein YjfL (UPF0719 family)
MWDFSEDEWVFMLVACAGALAGAWRWYLTLLRVSPLNGNGRSYTFLILNLAPLICLVLLMLVLQSLADPVYVAGHLDYTLLFMAGGACWIFSASETFGLMGISTADDAMRRRNPAAAIAVAGGVAGVTLAYAGSNIGNGPTIWTTLAPAFVATSVLLALWFILELIGGAFEAITLDRDVAAGIRLAAFVVCAGAILGRAMAGDWLDWESTFSEFVKLGWPSVLLIPPMVLMNRQYAPTPQRPSPELGTCGVIPAVIMLALTATYLVYLGLPHVAPPGTTML